MRPSKNRLILALTDAGNLSGTVAAAERFASAIDTFKVGLQLYTRYGPDLVRGLKTVGKVFLDLKATDTPDTVYDASREAARLGVDLFTVHAEGLTAMREARRGVDDMANAGFCSHELQYAGLPPRVRRSVAVGAQRTPDQAAPRLQPQP